MKPIEPSGGAEAGRPTVEQQAEAADLAARTAALPHGSKSRHGWYWWLGHVMFWLVALCLLAAVLMRVFHHDGNHLLTWINAFTRYVYLPAYVCLAWALWMRRWMLTLVSLTVVAFHLGWNLPDFVQDNRFDVPRVLSASAVVESQPVRIFFANVLATNQELTPLWKEIERAAPDVVVLAECSRYSDRSFRQTPALAAYVHTNGQRQSQIGEVKVYSKLPITTESQNWFAGRVVQKVDVAIGSRTLRVIGLHAPRPQLPEYDYFGYWERTVPVLTAEPGPVVMVGDFNATQHSRVYKQLQNSGLRSAHDDRGRGYATTWPNGLRPLPPIRIDQAFLSRDVECLSISEGLGQGSDHKPLIVDVALRDTKMP